MPSPKSLFAGGYKYVFGMYMHMLKSFFFSIVSVCVQYREMLQYAMNFHKNMRENRFLGKVIYDHYLPQVDVALNDPWRNSENDKV